MTLVIDVNLVFFVVFNGIKGTGIPATIVVNLKSTKTWVVSEGEHTLLVVI